MRKLFIIIFVLTSVHFTIFAKSTDTLNISKKWDPSVILGLNLSQIAFSNWVKGGENAVTWTILSDIDINYESDIWSLKNDFNIAYGRTKLGNAAFRTNNNEINLESVFSYNVGWIVDPFFSNSIRTQVTKGYDYEKDTKNSIADFFDPGYITQSFGFTYKQLTFGTTRVGVALQETITDIHSQYSDDDKTKGIENFRFETGIETVTKTEVLIDTNIKLKSKLRLFTRFENLDIWDVTWSSKFESKINSFLQVNLDFMLIYDKAQSLKTQFKEAFQLGIKYNLI
jgi:hypothetical protein